MFIENIRFIVVWSKNIFFGKDDVIYESHFSVKNEELVSNGTITLDIKTIERTTLKHDRKTVY
ncbi:unnamed protein product [Meloidogyne enterolobii]|uniref:Uncharacterized protein n=1 Tax=Meloidogyne enterolobii TaxID=390850 RepID=A0ACB1AKV2_MELEN